MRYRIERSIVTGARFPWLVLDARTGDLIGEATAWWVAWAVAQQLVRDRAVRRVGRW